MADYRGVLSKMFWGGAVVILLSMLSSFLLYGLTTATNATVANPASGKHAKKFTAADL